MGGGKEKWRRKRRETFGEGTYVSVEEKKNREWKIFGEETYFFAEEKEKEENIWRREIFGQGRIERTEKVFGEGKYLDGGP